MVAGVLTCTCHEQVLWVKPDEHLRLYLPPDVVDDFNVFVIRACEWVNTRILHPKSAPPGAKLPSLYGLATTAVLQSGVFPGVGRYTMEMFLRAGLCYPLELVSQLMTRLLISCWPGVSMYITVAELFFSPSHFARVIEGYWQWCRKSRSDVLW